MYKDSARNRYVEVPTLKDEHVRATIVPRKTAGYGVRSIRIQIRARSGRLRNGPEIPLESIDEFMKHLNRLLRKN